MYMCQTFDMHYKQKTNKNQNLVCDINVCHIKIKIECINQLFQGRHIFIKYAIFSEKFTLFNLFFSVKYKYKYTHTHTPKSNVADSQI